MPRGDGSGPMGMGPRTGRGLGDCITSSLPIIAGTVAGFSRRRGFGRGLCFWGTVFAGVATAAWWFCRKT